MTSTRSRFCDPRRHHNYELEALREQGNGYPPLVLILCYYDFKNEQEEGWPILANFYPTGHRFWYNENRTV